MPPKLRFFLKPPRKKQEICKLSASYQQITTRSTINYKLHSPGGPIPHNHGEGFDAPPTLERSGSEHRRAVTSFPFREGFLSPVRGTERDVKPIVAWLECGALLAGETKR